MSWILPLFISFASLLFGHEEADLVFVGDAMQHQGQIDAAKVGKEYDYSQCFKPLEYIISTADYAVVNLETPIGPSPHSGYPCFNAPTEYLDALADVGFDMMLTANNHTLDRGARGLRATLTELDARRLDHIGTYLNDSARAVALHKIVTINGFKIGFTNYTYGTNGIKPRDGVVVDYIDRQRIKADVEDCRRSGAELVCVCIHWGDEYSLLPNREQRNLADFLEAIGVDMIIGAHPHVIQPFELRPNRYYPERNVLLVYSLGNFISNMKTADTRGGAMVQVKLFRGDDHKAVVQSADYRLLFTIPGTSPSNNYRVMEVDSVPEGSTWKSRANEFKRRALNIFDKHNINVKQYTE